MIDQKTPVNGRDCSGPIGSLPLDAIPTVDVYLNGEPVRGGHDNEEI